MHIILLVLKIIGIALLVLLSVILLLLLTVLFVPVKYRIHAEKQEDIKAKAVVKWLFPFLFAKIEYSEEKLLYQVRIFGILIYPREKKGKETRKRGSKKERGRKGKQQEEPDLITMEIRTPEDAVEQKPTVVTQKEEVEGQKPAVMMQEAKAEEQKPAVVVQKTEDEKQKPWSVEQELEAVESKKATEQSPKDTGPKAKRKSKKKPEEKTGIPDGNQPRLGWFEKWKQKLVSLFEKIAVLHEKWRLIADFLKQEENKRGLLQIWNSVKHILRYMIPKKISGRVEFGLDDPCSTGQVLGIAGALYGFYGQSVQITPNFEEACLNGEIFIKGRLRTFTLLRICIKLLLDNNFKRLRINFEKLKEAL